MFLLLSRVLLWLLIGTIVYSLFQRFYPSGTFVGRLILVVILVIVALSFLNPNEPAVASLWRMLSFPLKPLGASVLLMILAAQKIKGGGIEKPGGYLIGWALTILLLASTPAVAYFLYRAPLAMTGETSVASATPTSGTLVALGQPTTANISDVTGDRILSYNLRVPPYLLQGNPQDIRTRGLRLEDFVPDSQTLQFTTRTWESYLLEVYRFLRVQR
ncbi:MAG: septal nanopore formation protein FraI [Nostoc sp.]